MQGPPEGADGYLPMVPESEQAAPDSGSDVYNETGENDVIYLTELQCIDYDNLSQRIRLSSSGSQRGRQLSSGGLHRARVSSTGSNSSGGYLLPQERRSAQRPKDIQLVTSPKAAASGVVGTCDAKVHSSSSSCSPESTPSDSHHQSEESDDQDHNSPLEPFLRRCESGQSDCSSPTTSGSGRRYKCNNSITLSDTSSGFHSDYVQDENSAATDYSSMVLGSLQRKEALV